MAEDTPFRRTGDRSAPPVAPVTLYPDGKFYPVTEDHPMHVISSQVEGKSLEVTGKDLINLVEITGLLLEEQRKTNMHLSLLTEVEF